MKKVVLSLLVIMVSVSFSVDANAQLLKRLKDKATRKVQDRVEQRIEQKIDEKIQEVAYRTVDRSWNSIFGKSPSGSPEESKGAAPSGLPFKMSANVATEDVYTFSKRSVMEIVSNDDDTEGPVLMKMFTTPNGDYSGTMYVTEEMRGNGEEMFMVYDYKNEAMVMLMESEEGKYSFAYEWSHPEMDDSQVDSLNGDYSKYYEKYESLGTKNILGYECDGYKQVTEDGTVEFWITNESIEGLNSAVSANSSTKYMRSNPMMMFPGGTVLEWHSKNNDGEEMDMKMIELNERVDKSFAMRDYPVIGGM